MRCLFSFILFTVLGVCSSFATSSIRESIVFVGGHSYFAQLVDNFLVLEGYQEFSDKLNIADCNQKLVMNFWNSNFEKPKSSSPLKDSASLKRVTAYDVEVRGGKDAWFLGYNTRKGRALREIRYRFTVLKKTSQMLCSKKDLM